MDYLGLETAVGGYNSILVVTDHFSKYAMAVPTRNQTAATTAKALVDLFIRHYGIPLRLHSDNGPSFTSKVITELCRILGMEKSHCSVYHPMGNGQTERYNRTLLNMLATLPSEKKAQWKDFVLPMVHAYNCTKHDSTGFAPFELMFGRKPRLPVDLVLGLDVAMNDVSHTDYICSLRNRLQEAFEKAKKNQDLSAAQMTMQYNKHIRGQPLQRGDKVLVRLLRFTEGKHKLENFWEDDTYVIISCHPDVPVYTVKKECGKGKVRKLHRNLLLPLGDKTSKSEDNEEDSMVAPYLVSDTEYDSDDSTEAPASQAQQLEAGNKTTPMAITLKDATSVADTTSQNTNKVDDGKSVLEEDLKDHLEESDKSTVSGESCNNDITANSGTQESLEEEATSSGPRRSGRVRKKPAWMTSGEYVRDFSLQSDEPYEKEKLKLLNKMLDLLS